MGQAQTKTKMTDPKGSSGPNGPGSGASGGTCSYVNACPEGQTCFECNCVPVCTLGTACPPGTTCQTVSNQFQTVTACLPTPSANPPVPIASGISESYQTFLNQLPVTLLNYFITTFANVDLSVLGVPGPSSGGTRGPISNINITDQVSQEIEVYAPVPVPIVGKVKVADFSWNTTTINGLEQAKAFVYPATGPVTVPTYGTINNSTTSYWDTQTGALHVNTVITVQVPSMTINLATTETACENANITLRGVQIFVPVELVFVPGLNILYSISISPSKIVPWITSPNFTIDSVGGFEFSCDNYANPLSAIIAAGINKWSSDEIISAITTGVNSFLTSTLNSLFGSYNSIVQGFLVKYGVINQYGDVLITSAEQIATDYLAYLALQGTNPIVLAILNAEFQKGINELDFIFEWEPVTFACTPVTIPAPSGCITYYTAQVQTFVGGGTTKDVEKRKQQIRQQSRQSQKGQLVGQQAPAGRHSSKRHKRGTPVVILGTNEFESRQAALAYCPNNKQGFQCSSSGQGCIPTTTLLGATYVYDPQNDSGTAPLVLKCTQDCIGRACGVASNQCKTVDQCAFSVNNLDPTNPNMELCDPTTLRGPGDCSKKCPAFELNPDGTGACIPQIGGSVYNDPSCGGGDGANTVGACVVDTGFTRSCYNTWPNSVDSVYQQGTPMTAAACQALTPYTGVAGIFYANQKCSSSTCDPTTNKCSSNGNVSQNQSCLVSPVMPGTSGQQSYQGWTPSQCPPTICDPKTNPCANGDACVSTPSGNVCKACTSNSQCASGPIGSQTCNTKSGKCGPCTSSSQCQNGQNGQVCLSNGQCGNPATGSCVFNSFGVQSCYDSFPVPNDPTYNQGTPMTSDSCTYLGTLVGLSGTYVPGGTCSQTCTTAGTCSGTSTTRNCLQYPGSLASQQGWTTAGCQ